LTGKLVRQNKISQAIIQTTGIGRSL